MYGTLVVNSWVGIHDGCDITFNVQGSDAVYATVSGTSQPFEFFFQIESLRTFLEQGSKALAEMNARFEQEEAERDASEQTATGDAAEGLA
jgi:hypothetical protein